MEGQEAGLIGAIVAAVIGAAKAVELFIGKLSAGQRRGPSIADVYGKLNIVEPLIKELYKWHDVRDSQTGAPLWYDKSDRMVDILARLEHSVERLTDVFAGLRDDVISKRRRDS